MTLDEIADQWVERVKSQPNNLPSLVSLYHHDLGRLLRLYRGRTDFQLTVDLNPPPITVYKMR